MPMRPPRVCACGHVIPTGRCPCEQHRDLERKARHDRKRPCARARGYDGRWEAYRVEFLRLNPICRRPGCNAPATVVDHIEPHRGNQRLFWSPANHQPLCTTCHASWKQALERRQQP